MQEENQFENEEGTNTTPEETVSKSSKPARRRCMSPISPTRRRIRPSHIQKGSDVELALAWLYSRDSTIKDAKYFKKLNEKIPLDANLSYEERAQDLVDTLAWMRQRRRARNQMESSCNTSMTV